VRSSSRAAALCLLSLTLATATAAATEEDSKTFFAQGRQLRAAGNCADAIVAFRRALDVFPQGLGALRNIAECEEQLGQFASARNDWWSLRTAVLQSNEPKYEGWEKHAEEGYTRLAPKVAKMIVRLRGAEPNQVRITIDGKPLDPRLVGIELERDLGPHTIEAVYGGATPIVEKRTLVAGSREEITLEIPALKQGPGGGTPGGPTPPYTGNSVMRAGGFVALGVGGLSAVGAVISLVVQRNAVSTVETGCGKMIECRVPHADLERLQAANTRAKTATILVDVLGGVAIAGVGVGIGLVVAGSGSRPPAKGDAPKPAAARGFEVKVGVAPTAGGAQLWTGGRFW